MQLGSELAGNDDRGFGITYRARAAAGTLGYAPREQLMGRAFPASDLYGLAMTYLAVASGREPEEMPLDGVRVDIRKVRASVASMIVLLEAMTEPDPRHRLVNAREALERLAPLRAPSVAPPR